MRISIGCIFDVFHVSGLGCLEELDLTRTELQELQDDAFRGLEKLKLLTMSLLPAKLKSDF